MAFSEFEQRLIEESLRHQREMNRALGGLSIQLLAKFRFQEETRVVSEAYKVFESHNMSAVSNAIKGISFAAREAMGKTVAGFHALAISSAQQAAIEALRATQHPKTYFDPFSGIGTTTNRAVHSHFASSRAALESSALGYTLELAAQAIAEANRVNISRLGALSGSSALAALDFSRFNNDLEQIRAINNSYSGQMAAALRELLNSPEISDETLQPIQDLLDSKIRSLPQGRISAEGLLTLILTLIGVLLTYGSHQFDTPRSLDSGTTTPRSETKQSNQIAELIQQLVAQTSSLIPEYDQDSYYLVDREATLRRKPRAKSFPFGSLLPNQKVRIVDRHHKWIYVEYFDEIEGVPRYGWAHKKYFKNIHSTVHRQFTKESEGLNKELRLAITDEWEATNAKRVSLIQKKLKNRITDDEKRELEYLQHLADERIRLVAPLPIEGFNSILDGVTRSN